MLTIVSLFAVIDVVTQYGVPVGYRESCSSTSSDHLRERPPPHHPVSRNFDDQRLNLRASTNLRPIVVRPDQPDHPRSNRPEGKVKLAY